MIVFVERTKMRYNKFKFRFNMSSLGKYIFLYKLKVDLIVMYGFYL